MAQPGSTGARARQAAGRRGRPSRLRRVGMVALGAAAMGLVGCRGVGGGTLTTTTFAPDVTVDQPATSSTSEPGPSTTSTGSNSPTTPGATSRVPKPPGRLELGGDDLGVTRVGAPFREAVSAVAAVLGPPTADPAPDSACIGAQEETSWAGFRLGRSGATVSGWLSTSSTLATPAGAKAGTTLNVLRQAYGTRLRLRPGPEPGDPTAFAVDGVALGGTLTGSAPTDTVTRLHNGTCEAS